MSKSKDPLEGVVKVVNSATCMSLSGKSNITYQIGADADGNSYLRIYGNTGGGFFSPEWVPLADVQKFIADAPTNKPLSSWSLHPLFRGKSVNTPAFFMAALVHEKWLRILRGKKRGLEVLDEAPFMAKLGKLTGNKSPSSKRAAAKPAAAKPQKPTGTSPALASATAKPAATAKKPAAKAPAKKPAGKKRAAV
jgi:hypothetical protein